MTNIDSELQSINGNIKAAALAAQVRHADADEVHRIVMDEKEGLRARIRSLEDWRVEIKELKAYVSGQIKTWVTVGVGIASLVQIALKLWRP